MVEQQAQEFVILSGPRLAFAPEKSVVNQKEICAFRDRLANGRRARIHGGRDAVHLAAVLDLQSIHGPVVINYRGGVQQPIAIRGDLFERSFCHAKEMTTNRRGVTNSKILQRRVDLQKSMPIVAPIDQAT